MRADIEAARQRLIDGDYTCVILNNSREYTSKERGVRPLLDFLDSEDSFSGAVAADKTVGAGAAHLYVLLGVRSLWANVISESAEALLRANGIDVFYAERVPYIINRRGDGRCPIECAVEGASSSEEAYSLIKEALRALNAK